MVKLTKINQQTNKINELYEVRDFQVEPRV